MIPQKHTHILLCLSLTNSYSSLKTLLLLRALPCAHAPHIELRWLMWMCAQCQARGRGPLTGLGDI